MITYNHLILSKEYFACSIKSLVVYGVCGKVNFIYFN